MGKMEEALYTSALATVTNRSDKYRVEFADSKFRGLVDDVTVCTGVSPTDIQKKLATWLVNKRLEGNKP